MSNSDDEKPSQRFGEKLRYLRQQHGLTQYELATMLVVSRPYVGRLESGEKIPNVAMLLKLSEIFDVSVDVLIKDQLELE